MNALVFCLLLVASSVPVFSAQEAEPRLSLLFPLFTSGALLASISLFYHYYPTPTHQMVGSDYSRDYEYDNNYDCNCECDPDYDCGDDDSIGHAGWLPTKTNPSVHVPDPSTMSIDSPTVTNEHGSANVLGSQIGITVYLYLVLACVVFCAGFIWRFIHVQAAHKSSTVSGPNAVETKDSDTDNIETVGLNINASD